MRTKQHKIWLDLEYGNIWCAACSDYVYDTELKVIHYDTELKVIQYDTELKVIHYDTELKVNSTIQN